MSTDPKASLYQTGSLLITPFIERVFGRLAVLLVVSRRKVIGRQLTDLVKLLSIYSTRLGIVFHVCT